MGNFSIKLLNSGENGTLQYLPFGISTIVLTIEGDKSQAHGYLYTKRRSSSTDNIYVGYSDNSDNFIVLWGAGKENGLNINWQNSSKKAIFASFA